jgi:hypothetical protein
MPTYNYKAGLGNVGSYQVAAVPWVSGNINPNTTPRIDFPSVTSWIVVHNHGANPARVGFSSLGLAGTNYITIPSGSSSPRLELKVVELYLGGTSTSIDVCAGLTGIPVVEINNQSVSPDGTNWSGSAGALVG